VKWILLGILLLGLFFRTYKLADLMEYGHEQDLQSWIVKDILIDKHQRLIGQETSVTGVFIGSLYNYLEAIGYKIFNMDPIGGYVPLTIVSGATILSVYWVLKQLYGQRVGLVGSLIYSASISIVFLDRWMVPTQYTLLWVIWFYYVAVLFFRGKFTGLPILIVLAGLVWHIHIAFIPLFILPLGATIYWRKRAVEEFKLLNQRNIIISLGIALILLSPLFAFEARHGWQQLKALTETLNRDVTVLKGSYRWEIVLWNTDRVLWAPISARFMHWDIHKMNLTVDFGYFSLFVLTAYILYTKKVLPKNDLLLVLLWIADVAISQGLSLRPISEYYFNNLLIVSMIILAIGIEYGLRSKLKWIIAILGILWIIGSLKDTLIRTKTDGEYVDKKTLVEYLGQDYRNKGYHCAGVNFVGDLGSEYGYRYLIWKNDVNQVAPGDGIPVYNVFVPSSRSIDPQMKKFGSLGIIPPDPTTNIDYSVCSNLDRKLYPLNGFVN